MRCLVTEEAVTQWVMNEARNHFGQLCTSLFPEEHFYLGLSIDTISYRQAIEWIPEHAFKTTPFLASSHWTVSALTVVVPRVTGVRVVV